MVKFRIFGPEDRIRTSETGTVVFADNMDDAFDTFCLNDSRNYVVAKEYKTKEGEVLRRDYELV